MDRVAPLLTPMRGRMIHDIEGSQQLQPYGSRPDEVIHSVSRTDLNAILLDAAQETGGVVHHFNQRCVGGSAVEGVLRFEHYETGERSDVETVTIFGADGWGSPIRDIVVAEAGAQVQIEPLDHGYKELTLPAGPGGGPLLDPNALHIWPRGGYMLIALANADCSFTCTLFAPNDGDRYSLASLTDGEAITALFESEFPDFAVLVPDLVSQFLENPTGHLGTIRVDGWHVDDRAVILGDAAHAIVPFHGQGMNAAFESCSVLMSAIERHPHDWASAFSEFEAIRKPDVDAIADMALDNYVEMRSSVRDDRYVLKRELALELERRWPDRFIPRYSMVMFSTMPYAEAQRRAEVQAGVLDELTAGASGIEDVDFERARELVEAL